MLDSIISLILLPWTLIVNLPTTLMWISVLSFATYIVPILAQAFYFDKHPVDLKAKYNAQWALVTGGSSGIGKCIVERCAQQGLNVVIVALGDAMLDETTAAMKKTYKKVQFRSIGVNLGSSVIEDYMGPIQEDTADIEVQLVFNNAGFITTGFFHDIPLGKNMANFNCNAGCTLPISHHFLGRLRSKNLPGFFGYTSSSAAFLPNPLSSMYASTKAFLTMFASSLAAEVRGSGIDVCVVHPSPMATNFFSNAGQLDTLKAFIRFAADPFVIADILMASAGRFVVRDQGAITIILRLLLKCLDINFLSDIICRTAHLSGDYKKLNKAK